jgi:hypothetical protein
VSSSTKPQATEHAGLPVWKSHSMKIRHKQSLEIVTGWSADEELVIATIQETELVSRPEAIRRMQRRKKSPGLAIGTKSLKRPAAYAASRMCWNPRCTRGEDHGPGSLIHLRADARYCNATCKKAGQRSLKRENRRQIANVYAGLKGTNLALWHHPSTLMDVLSKSPAIAISRFGFGDSRTGRDVTNQPRIKVNHECENIIR